MCQMESSLFPIRGMITRIFWELSLASKENPLTCSIAVSREVHKFILTSLTGSLSFRTMDTLNPHSDNELNNNVSSLYIEIIDKN